jgi:acyl-CoA thioesterase FadM
MAFEHQVTCRFFQVDRAGIMFFGRVFELCHIAFEEMLGDIFGPVAQTFESNDFGMPIVHCHADFKRPINMQDRLMVAVEVARYTERSVTFEYTLTGDDGVVRATATIKNAFVSLSAFESKPPPAVLTDGLRRLGLI